MAPDIHIMRQEVSAMYDGRKWRRRVAMMPDHQVMAIYFREQKRKEEEAKKPKEQTDDEPDIPF
jgi:hypothetical protein